MTADLPAASAHPDILAGLAQALLAQASAPAALAVAERALSLALRCDRVHLVLRERGGEALSLLTTAAVSSPAAALLESGPAAGVIRQQTEYFCDGASFAQKFPALAASAPYRQIGCCLLLPLSTARQRLGAIEFIKHDTVGLSEPDRDIVRHLAPLLALVLEKLDDAAQRQEAEERLRHERDAYRVLVDVTNAVIACRELADLVAEVSEPIHRFLGIDYVGLDVHDPVTQVLHSHALHFRAQGAPLRLAADIPLPASLAARVFQSKTPLLAQREALEALARTCDQATTLLAKGFQSSCTLPLISGGQVRGALNLAHTRGDAFSADTLSLLQEIAARVTIAMDNALAYEEISRLKDKLASENLYLTEEIRDFGRFGEIIGESAAMTAVLEQVEMVASSDCTVLILGETGTGKELVARAIHSLSERRAQTMVKMNCAAIPAGLLESDLFGHEKGAYTGAAAQRIGRFELADKGTLFLDEVGDIPLELQPKLLRALQEREIERLGGRRVIPVDVRVIAATNRDLTAMVANREYRSDLYYRLNVFPIVIPPLRERPEDIPLLARYFTHKIACRMNRHIESIPAETLERLTALAWPGNVRELQNVIERAVILSRGPTLNLPLNQLQYHLSPVTWKAPPPSAAAITEPPAADTPEAERDKIVRVLRETNGIVAGPKGAASRLGLKRTTLLSRMQRLGISTRDFAEGGTAEAFPDS